jgi:hypothetical protein
MHYSLRRKSLFENSFSEEPADPESGGEAEEVFKGNVGLGHGKKGEAE